MSKSKCFVIMEEDLGERGLSFGPLGGGEGKGEVSITWRAYLRKGEGETGKVEAKCFKTGFRIIIVGVERGRGGLDRFLNHSY